MVIVTFHAGAYRNMSEGLVAGVVLLLSYLMVSRIRFRSFKAVRITRKTVGLALLAVGSAMVVVMNGVDKALIFLLLITAYIVLGFTETVILMKRRFFEQRLLRQAQAAGDAPPPDEEEVLRELGAFDGEGGELDGGGAEAARAAEVQPPVSTSIGRKRA
jgi:CDP-diacylglycerol--serine O-phosphatidyltransferase